MRQIRILISRFFMSQYSLLFVDSIVPDGDNVAFYMTGENPIFGLAQFVFINPNVYLKTSLN